MTFWKAPEGVPMVDQIAKAFATCPDCDVTHITVGDSEKIKISLCAVHRGFWSNPDEAWKSIINQPLNEKVVEFREGFKMPCFDDDVFSWVLGPNMDNSERLWLQSVLKPGMCFWDVGANNGLYTGVASRLVGPTGHVVAFEPEPGAYLRLQKTIAFNGFENVSIHNVALSNSIEEMPFYLALKGNDGGFGTNQKAQNPAVMIRAETISFILEFGIAETLLFNIPDVLKIDTNGTEWAVLEGARVLLETKRIPILCKVDKDNTFLGKDSRAIYDAVPNFYRWYKVTGDGTLQAHERQEKPFKSHGNLVGLAE